VLISIRTPGVA